MKNIKHNSKRKDSLKIYFNDLKPYISISQWCWCHDPLLAFRPTASSVLSCSAPGFPSHCQPCQYFSWSPACHSHLISATTFTCVPSPYLNPLLPLSLCQIVLFPGLLPWIRPCLSLTRPRRSCLGNLNSLLSLTSLPACPLSVSS